ncbi:MAG: 3D domain-containing protein, partial [Phycisphaeraceae bacterium]
MRRYSPRLPSTPVHLSWATVVVSLCMGVWVLTLLLGLKHFGVWSEGQPMGLMAVDTVERARPSPVAPQAAPVAAGAVTQRPIQVKLSAVADAASESVVLDRQAGSDAAVSGTWFNGRPLHKAQTLRMVVTAYSPDYRSCGRWADGITASGYSVWTNGMKLVAADTRVLSFGSIITVPGYNQGRPVQVLDRGGKIRVHRLDVLYPTHEVARRWGRRTIDVTVW